MIKRWIIRLFLGFTVLFLFFHGLLFFILSQSAIKQMVGNYISDSMNAECSIESASLNHFPDISIRLKGIVIKPAQGIPFSAQAIRADMAFIPLLWGEIKVTHIYLERPQLALEAGPEGRISLNGLSLSSDVDGRIGYKGQLDIRGAEIAFYPTTGTHYFVEECDADLSLSLDKDTDTTVQGGIKLHNCKAWENDQNHPLFEGLDFAYQGLISISANQSTLKLENSKIWLGKAELQVSGSSIDRFSKNPVSNFHLSGSDVDLSEITKVMPKSILVGKDELSIGGYADIDIRINSDKSSSNSAGEYHRDGRILLKDATVALQGSNTDLKKINGTFEISDNGIKLSNITGQADTGSFLLNGMYSSQPQPIIDLNIKGDMEIGVLARLLGLPPEWKIAGKCQVDGSLKGGLNNPETLSVSGSLRPVNAIITTPFLEKSFSSVNGLVTFTGSGANADLSASLESGLLNLKGEVQNWGTPSFSIKVESPKLDLDQAKPKKGQADKQNKETTKAVIFSLDGEFSCTDFKMLGIKASNVKSSFTTDGELFKLTGFSAQSYGGTIRLNGNIQLTEPQPKYNLIARLRNVNIGSYLTDETSLQGTLTGKLAADIQFSATGTASAEVKKSLVATGKATMTNGRVKDLVTLQKLADFTGLDAYKNLSFISCKTGFTIRDGLITLAQVEMTGADMDIKANGTIGLDLSLKLDLESRLSKPYTDSLSGTKRTLKMVKDNKGQGYVAVKISGLAEDPNFLLNTELMNRFFSLTTSTDSQILQKPGLDTGSQGTGEVPPGWFK